jgi:hypothetical protein
MRPLTFCRKESTMCLFMVCHEPAKSPLRWWNKEGDKSAIRRINILNSLKRSGWTRWQAMSNLENFIALSPKLELGCRWGAGRTNLILANQKPTLIVLEEAILHVGGEDKDDMIACIRMSTNHQSRVDYRPSLVRPWLWLQDDVPKLLEMKPACKY